MIYVSEELGHNIVLTMSVRNVHLQSFPAISESTFVDVTARHWMIDHIYCKPVKRFKIINNYIILSILQK